MKKEIKIDISWLFPLALIFIGSKAIGLITWPWVWVLAPLWCVPVIIGVYIGFLLIISLIIGILGLLIK